MAKQVQIVKRGPGRPPKNPPAAAVAAPVKRGPGRPPKSPEEKAKRAGRKPDQAQVNFNMDVAIYEEAKKAALASGKTLAALGRMFFSAVAQTSPEAEPFITAEPPEGSRVPAGLKEEGQETEAAEAAEVEEVEEAPVPAPKKKAIAPPVAPPVAPPAGGKKGPYKFVLPVRKSA
jgi:hypothetical protein